MAPEDVSVLDRRYGGAPLHRPIERWQHMLAAQESGARVVVIADLDGSDVLQTAIGYCSLRWESAHPPFQSAGIPEIHDLWIDRAHRRRGIGTAIVEHLEDRARSAGCVQVGIGVGLYTDYGPAQRRYVRMGYIPDGQGATSSGEPVIGGQHLRCGDDVLIWLVKALR